MFMLYSSKTHTKGMKPQEIKISTKDDDYPKEIDRRHFCPFTLARQYLELRGEIYVNDSDPFFVFSDFSPVYPSHVRKVLRQALDRLGLDSQLYNTHSLRSGRAIDMFEKFHKSLDFVKAAGRWQSNVICRYLKKF